MTVALIVVVFIVLCALMYTKKLNAMFALPIMALLIAHPMIMENSVSLNSNFNCL